MEEILMTSDLIQILYMYQKKRKGFIFYFSVFYCFYYEYLVGTKFINKVNEIFPCFTETYHLFKHRSAMSTSDLLKNVIEVSEYSKRLFIIAI
jgi:hypothetical protein